MRRSILFSLSLALVGMSGNALEAQSGEAGVAVRVQVHAAATVQGAEAPELVRYGSDYSEFSARLGVPGGSDYSLAVQLAQDGTGERVLVRDVDGEFRLLGGDRPVPVADGRHGAQAELRYRVERADPAASDEPVTVSVVMVHG